MSLQLSEVERRHERCFPIRRTLLAAACSGEKCHIGHRTKVFGFGAVRTPEATSSIQCELVGHCRNKEGTCNRAAKTLGATTGP